jgi:hypothetical protein
VDPRRAGALDCPLGPRPEEGVLGDQRAVEVARERRDLAGERRRQLEQRYGGVPPVAFTT